MTILTNGKTLSSLPIIIFLFFFFICASHDSLKQAVPTRIFHIFFRLGIPVFIFCRILAKGTPSPERIFQAFASFLPGFFLFFLNRLTQGDPGIGDAFFLLVAGCYLPLAMTSLLLGWGIVTSGITGICLIIYGRWKHIRMKGKGIPLIPCMLPAIYTITRELFRISGNG